MTASQDQDLGFMRLALREARRGIGRTSPNPAVGAVVVRDGLVVGKGFHRKAGTPHAEIHALRAAGHKAAGATLYVTLEPCNHSGRTPPCTEAILASGLKRVVVGMADPNPGVTGGGSDYLAAHGIAVVRALMPEACLAINRPFVKHTTTGLPWVIMKAGCSLDGRLAVGSGRSGWVTGPEARANVHRVRDQVDAILVGIGTVLADDPSLTTRLPGRRGKDALRVVLDTGLRLPCRATLLRQQSAAATWIFCGSEAPLDRQRALEAAGAVVKRGPVDRQGRVDLRHVLAELGRCQCTSVLVEGGGLVHADFLAAGLVDQVLLYLAPLFIGGDGVPLAAAFGLGDVGQAPRLRITQTRRFGDDLRIEGLFERK